jgi:hypothetical protein
MIEVNTDRTKVLQMTILSMMRAMRSVLCQVLRCWIIVDPLSASSSDDQGALKAAFNALVADERTVDGPGA